MVRRTSAKSSPKKRRPGKRGRPSLIYDSERVNRLLAAVRKGNWLTTSAALAGLGEHTVREWLYRGQAAQELADRGGEVPEDETVYQDFAGRFEEAEAEAEAHVVSGLVSQTGTSPQAATGFLKMRWPKRWREAPSQVEVSGPQGGPIALSPVLAQMSQEELERKAKQLEAELEAQDDDD